VFVVLAASVTTAAPYTPEWVRQIGTNRYDYSEAVSADPFGNVYISGYTEGNLSGTNAGAYDAFLSKYDGGGNLLWTSQLGTSLNEHCYGVSADASGNVYISGRTYGSLGAANAGDSDAFVSKYDGSGMLQWTRQIGTSRADNALAVSTDASGNVYISGQTSGSLGGSSAGSIDAFVSKLSNLGNLIWSRQIGTSADDRGLGVSSDAAGNVFITGYTNGSLGGSNAGGFDAFVTKYNAAGAVQWSRQIGTSGYDTSHGVSVDPSGNVYVGGFTEGSLGGTNAGLQDAFVRKYDGNGNVLWTGQIGTSGGDFGEGLSTDASGNVYISGFTNGSLGGPKAGSYDAFASMFNGAGTLLWSRQLGTGGDDESYAVSADALGNVYISGMTYGSLGGPNAGDTDAFVAKIPEPGSLSLVLALPLAMRRRRRHRIPVG
jgi:hypothetical protein